MAMMRTHAGVLVALECSRVAVGEQNNYGIEVHGTTGLIEWDFRTPGELRLSTGSTYADQPTQRLRRPGRRRARRFQPGSSIPTSWATTPRSELAGFVRSILSGTSEGCRAADAVASAEAWMPWSAPPPAPAGSRSDPPPSKGRFRASKGRFSPVEWPVQPRRVPRSWARVVQPLDGES